MDEFTNTSIEQLVRHFKDKALSRSRFIAVLSGLGASATGIATLLVAAEVDAPAPPSSSSSKSTHQAEAHHHTRLHEAHVRDGRAQQHAASRLPRQSL